jgi:hypothetical protein
MVDEAYMNQYSNATAARDHAQSIFATMKSNLEEEIFEFGFYVEFHSKHFTLDVAPNSWYSSEPAAWANSIRNYWSGPSKNCIPKQGIIFLTGQSPGYDGVQNGP